MENYYCFETWERLQGLGLMSEDIPMILPSFVHQSIAGAFAFHTIGAFLALPSMQHGSFNRLLTGDKK